MSLQAYLQKHYTAQTARAYAREIGAYIKNYPNAAQARHQDIVHYLGQLRSRYHNAATLRRILSSLKAYYAFLSYSGERGDNPAKSIRLRDPQSRDIQLQDLFTPAELESLLTRKERYHVLDYRNKVLMSLLIYQGLLPGELASLTVDDINLDQGTVYIQGTTKTHARTLQLKPNQVMLLYHYLHEVRPRLLKKHAGSDQEQTLLISQRGNPETVSSLVSHVKRMKDHFSGRRLNMQTIRQSVIRNLLKAGHDLRIVQVFAGHKNPSTTERYKQRGIEELQQAIRQLHPFGKGEPEKD